MIRVAHDAKPVREQQERDCGEQRGDVYSGVRRFGSGACRTGIGRTVSDAEAGLVDRTSHLRLRRGRTATIPDVELFHTQQDLGVVDTWKREHRTPKSVGAIRAVHAVDEDAEIPFTDPRWRSRGSVFFVFVRHELLW
ncbi:MAG TPA: hypothetical protein VH539_25105 [Gemmatimonadaceae bacterium]